MSIENIKLIENEFIQTWEEKEQRKKREFMDDMICEKEILEKTIFFRLNYDEDDITSGSFSTQKISMNSGKIKGSLTLGEVELEDFIRCGGSRANQASRTSPSCPKMDTLSAPCACRGPSIWPGTTAKTSFV